jgi:hypothetical protein
MVSDDRATRQAAVELLAAECREHEDLVRDLEGPIVERFPAAAADGGALTELLERHASAADPYLRAAAVWAASKEIGIAAGPIVAMALKDPNELVRETAVAAARHILEIAEADALASEGEPAFRRLQAPEFRPRGGETPYFLAELWEAIGSDPASSFSSLSTIERMQLLRAVPLFSGLDPEDLHELSRVTEQQTVVAPRVLCKEGDTEVDDLFVVVGGRASVVVASRDESGEERELEVLDPGAVIGELSLLDGGPRSATVRPKDGPLQVLRISGWYFRTRLLHRQRVTNPLLGSMTRIIRRLLLRAAGAQPFVR